MPDRKFTGLTKESHFTTFASCLWCLDIICSIFYFFFFWDTKIPTSNGRVCHLLRERCLTEVTVPTVQSLRIGPYSWRYSYYWHIFLWEQITTRVWRSCSVRLQVSGVLSLLADLSPLFFFPRVVLLAGGSSHGRDHNPLPLPTPTRTLPLLLETVDGWRELSVSGRRWWWWEGCLVATEGKMEGEDHQLKKWVQKSTKTEETECESICCIFCCQQFESDLQSLSSNWSWWSVSAEGGSICRRAQAGLPENRFN